MAKKTVSIKITTTITIDVEEWCMNYGTTPGQVRKDVAAYTLDLIAQSVPCQAETNPGLA